MRQEKREGRGAPAAENALRFTLRSIGASHFSLHFFPSFSGYFSQFGAITRLRVSRNKKTAKARSYGFIEFASPDVAAIAAEAMDG